MPSLAVNVKLSRPEEVRVRGVGHVRGADVRRRVVARDGADRAQRAVRRPGALGERQRVIAVGVARGQRDRPCGVLVRGDGLGGGDRRHVRRVHRDRERVGVGLRAASAVVAGVARGHGQRVGTRVQGRRRGRRGRSLAASVVLILGERRPRSRPSTCRCRPFERADAAGHGRVEGEGAVLDGRAGARWHRCPRRRPRSRCPRRVCRCPAWRSAGRPGAC